MKTTNVALARARADVDLDTEIRGQVQEYLDDGISLTELRVWLGPRTRYLPRSSMAAPLAFGVQLAIDEYSSGHATKDELRSDLRRLLNRFIQVVRSTGFRGTVHRETRQVPLEAVAG